MPRERQLAMPIPRWQKPATKYYDNNYSFGMNFYQPMIDWLDDRDRGLPSRDRPHLPWLNERGLKKYDPSQQTIKTYSKERTRQLAVDAQLRAKESLREPKEHDILHPRSPFSLAKQVEVATSLTKKVLGASIEERHADKILRERELADLRRRTEEVLYDYRPKLPSMDAEASYRARSRRAIANELIMESLRHLQDSRTQEEIRRAYSDSRRSVRTYQTPYWYFPWSWEDKSMAPNNKYLAWERPRYDYSMSPWASVDKGDEKAVELGKAMDERSIASTLSHASTEDGTISVQESLPSLEKRESVSRDPSLWSLSSLLDPPEHAKVITFTFGWHEDETESLIRVHTPVTFTVSDKLSLRIDVSVGNESRERTIESDDEISEETSMMKILLIDSSEGKEDFMVKSTAEIQLRYAPVKTKIINKVLLRKGGLLAPFDLHNTRSIQLRLTLYNFNKSPLPGISRDWKTLYESREMNDITIKLEGGEVLRAHKQVLCARSHVFRKMLQSGFAEGSSSQIEIMGILGTVFEKLLEFLYTGVVEEFDGLELEVLMAADRYQLSELHDLCQWKLAVALCADPSDVLPVLAIANSVNARELKETALQVAVNSLGQILDKPEWVVFRDSNICLVDDVLRTLLKAFETAQQKNKRKIISS